MASPHDVYLLGLRLYNAALRGDQCQVALALDQGAAIDWHSTNYNLRLNTALHAAASNGHAPVVRLLLDRKASIDAVDGENERPLHVAARAGHEPVVRLLLDRRASIDATDNFSKQPLYYAVREGHEPVVRLLLGQRADPMPLDPTTGPHCTWLPTRATNPSLKCCSIEELTPQSYQCVTLQPLNATMSYTCSQ